MMELDQINTIVTESGPLDEEIISVARVADDRWMIQFEPIIISLEADAERGRLMLIGEIGPVPEERRNELLTAMLSYGLLWRETGGLRMAVSQSDNVATLMVDLAGEEIEPRLIACVAANLAERTLLWQAVFALEAPVPEAAELEGSDLIKI